MPLDRRLIDGHATEPPAPLTLHAGPLSLVFDGSGVRYVRCGEREVVRRVYYAVRDANWGTVPDRISNLRTNVQDDSFRIEFDVENKAGEIDFAWHGVITGEASGRVVFEARGVANSSFKKNRIGFCVLHPMECAGLPVEIRHADGSPARSEFPRYIADKNPFLDVVGMRHESGPGANVDLTFEGDVFETEDQRNWIDASFKTFCTPLSRPFPVEVRQGERIFQRITIAIEGKAPTLPAVASADGAIELRLATTGVGELPHLGFVLPNDAELSASQMQRLRLLRPGHLRCELRLAGEFEAILRKATATAKELGTRLEVAVFAGMDRAEQLEKLVRLSNQLQPRIARWAVFPENGWSTTKQLVEFAAGYLRKYDHNIPIGGGTPANFRELNAARPSVESLNFITWSMTPQIHAFDNASLVETLAAHTATVESAQSFASGWPLVVGPIALKMQVNPYATGDWPPSTPAGQLPPQVDVRQLSLFGAGWTLGSIKYLAESGVQAATYYEVTGWNGLMERQEGSQAPGLFPSLPGCVFPLYHVFADLAELPGAKVMPIRSSAPLRVEAIAIRSGERTRVMVASFSNESESVTLATGAMSARIRLLDERSVVEAMKSPETYRTRFEVLQTEVGQLNVSLPRFAIATIDLL